MQYKPGDRVFAEGRGGGEVSEGPYDLREFGGPTYNIMLDQSDRHYYRARLIAESDLTPEWEPFDLPEGYEYRETNGVWQRRKEV